MLSYKEGVVLCSIVLFPYTENLFFHSKITVKTGEARDTFTHKHGVLHTGEVPVFHLIIQVKNRYQKK